ncbi:pollen-specific leucine-rich repeat extensin-like protein 1 isoform X2 [Homalodisca vitripennis]|uniref:pollen-specific leucine-rich repeat extensin-like protein 1 isoform X2 n=1 Tax=Homalodisca vitripennis TaxID=197043 RepID=UPI001EEB2042|nr:pollen-specific leucine-rich repeat extensin-like protein 1 isoform X2 [Homalodisca vitripennis]
MSYNTRRTGGRGAPPTQVNYHQQPNRTGGGGPQQSRNPGYSTTPNSQTTYNSSSQPAYTTQTTFSTAPPPTTQTKPQPPAAAQPPLPAQTPATPQTPTTPQPQVKQEPPTPTDTPKTETSTTSTSENGDGPKPFWKKKPFVKVSNKVRKARQNAKLRRILNPKNALTFLNELRPGGVKFVIREEPGWGFVASVEIDGKTFSGNALTVSKAKVQASEQALKHVLLEQLSKSQTAAPPTIEKKEIEEKEEQEDEEMETNDKEESGEPKSKRSKMDQPEDDLPWGSLAAFALHKLFAEWQKEGAEPHPPPQDKYDEEMADETYFTRRPGPPEFGYPRRFAPGGPFRGRGYAPYPPRGVPPPPGFGPMARRPPPPPAATFLQGAPKPALPLPTAVSSMMPMKKIPEDANKRHPVMILNQLKPNVIYNESREGQPPHVMFIISVEIDGKEYTGKGKSKKDAKKNAAKAALAPLGIIYEEDN